jgi:hypothetical protein
MTDELMLIWIRWLTPYKQTDELRHQVRYGLPLLLVLFKHLHIHSVPLLGIIVLSTNQNFVLN